jgi:hypothetical protein
MPDIVLFKQSIKAFEGLAAIAGFINWGKWKHSYWKWFPVYLVVLFFTECAGHLLAYLNLREANGSLYNYWGLPLEFLFYCWLYYRCFDKNMKLLPAFCAAVFIISWTIEQVFIKERSAYFSSFSYCIGNIVIVIMVTAFILKFSLSQAIRVHSKLSHLMR